VYIWHENAWGLTELLDFIPEAIKKWKPGEKEQIGLGRNCTVFDQTRGFAYSEWRHQGFNDQSRLMDAVFNYAMNINVSFNIPMLDKEVHCIARSISKWTARHMDAGGLRAWHQEQNRKSVIVRRKAAIGRSDEIKIFYDSHPNSTRKELAKKFDVSEKTIQRLKLIKRG
jgi:hypothetical protein